MKVIILYLIWTNGYRPKLEQIVIVTQSAFDAAVMGKENWFDK